MSERHPNTQLTTTRSFAAESTEETTASASSNAALPLPDSVPLDATLQDQLAACVKIIHRIETTLLHYRTWAAQMQARYQLYNPDAARPAKRVYIGDLSSDVTESELREYINSTMVERGGCASPGLPIVGCKLYPATSPSRVRGQSKSERSYAFVEFRSVEEASNCMALDGTRFHDTHLKVRRPNNYDPNMALMLGPSDPNPAMNLVGLDVVRTVVHDTSHKIFVGGLPCDWTEDQVKDLLLGFGRLAAFNLVQDRTTGSSKGYAFCEYADVDVTPTVIAALNGTPVGNKFLTVKLALSPPPL